MQMPQQMYEDMLRQRDADSFRWDSLSARNVTIGDLDEKQIRAAVEAGVKSKRISPAAREVSIEEILSKLKLLNDGKPTNAAVMLFGKNTDDYPEFELRMGYFKGVNKMVFKDTRVEFGNFFELIEAGISFCYRNLRLGGVIRGMLREEELELPPAALREALTNALCHRQYERTNGSVSLAIYDDRVEIINPGKFPPQLTADSVRKAHESFPYNKKIAQVLYLTNNLEKWGTGTNRMIDLCREQGVPAPEWTVEDGTVKVVFKRVTATTSDADFQPNKPYSTNTETETILTNEVKQTLSQEERRKLIVELLKRDNRMSASDIAKKSDTSDKTILRDLKMLGIHWVGHPKTGHWHIDDV